MYQHHREAIETITRKLKTREDILGIIVAGSVAHGFENEASDIDLMLVLSDEDYERALKSGEIGYYETEATHTKADMWTGNSHRPPISKKWRNGAQSLQSSLSKMHSRPSPEYPIWNDLSLTRQGTRSRKKRKTSRNFMRSWKHGNGIIRKDSRETTGT